MFIRMPFVVEGIIQGLVGGLCSCGFIYLVVDYASKMFGGDLAAIVFVEPTFYVVILASGTMLGLLGSIISVRKFISESVALTT